jgi:hypothetical protein
MALGNVSMDGAGVVLAAAVGSVDERRVVCDGRESLWVHVSEVGFGDTVVIDGNR